MSNNRTQSLCLIPARFSTASGGGRRRPRAMAAPQARSPSRKVSRRLWAARNHQRHTHGRPVGGRRSRYGRRSGLHSLKKRRNRPTKRTKKSCQRRVESAMQQIILGKKCTISIYFGQLGGSARLSTPVCQIRWALIKSTAPHRFVGLNYLGPFFFSEFKVFVSVFVW